MTDHSAEENLKALEEQSKGAPLLRSYRGHLTVLFEGETFAYFIAQHPVSRERAISSIATFNKGAPTMIGESRG